jgi:hypothetical protein
METVNGTSAVYFPVESTASRSQQISQLQLAAVNSSQSIDLALTTKEGDKVTLSIDAQASALYAAFGEAESGDGDGYNARFGELSIEEADREVTLTVQGDLNKDERREIRKVIKTIDKMMREFVEGDLGALMGKADKLQGLRTVDNLELSMAYERQEVVAQQRQALVAYDQSGAAVPDQAAAGQSSDGSLKDRCESLASRMAQEVSAAKAPADFIRRLMAGMFKSHRRQAVRHHPLGGRIMDHLQHLFQAAVGRRRYTDMPGLQKRAVTDKAA